MRLDMCDSLPPTPFITTSGNLLEGNHETDISLLKSRVRKCNFDEDSQKPCFSSDIPSSPESISEHDLCSSKYLDREMCSQSGEVNNECSQLKKSNSENGVSTSEKHCDIGEENLKHNGTSSSLGALEQSGIKRVNSKELKAGLLISPLSLTQDLPISVGEDDNRLSSVLENIPTPLVYLPNTRQLVTEASKESSDSRSVSSCDVNNVVSESCQNEGSDEDTVSICDKWKLVNLHDTSSIGETDSLLRLKDPDQLTCNSFDLDGSLHRVQTGDSLLRTFNDASSLSSMSTCTDFSVSAISMGDDASDGTGMCLDTGDGNFIEVNLHTRNSFERSKNNSADSGIEDQGAKPKRRGISGFLSR